MASTVERRRSGHTRSRSPASERGSPPRRRSSPPRRERSPAPRSGSPRRRPPHRERSPQREKVKERARSPKQVRSQSRSPSPAARKREEPQSLSPRTKRLKRAQAEREAAEATEGERRRPSSREERDSGGRHRERDEGRDASRERKVERRDGGRDHSRDRRADRDDRSGASREARSGRDDDRHDPRGRRSDQDDRRGADSRDRRGSDSGRMADREDTNGGSGRSSRRGRSVSPEEHRHRGRNEYHSSPRASRNAARIEDTSFRGGDAESRMGDPDPLAVMNTTAEALEAKEKQKPSFELSGKLAEETNKVAGVNLLYSEPPEARKSDIRWRLYVFKGDEQLNEPLYVHRMSHYLFGRERKVADIPTDHPSCSKQHAVLQYRLVEKEQADGMMAKKVCPYLMDLGSTNGTFINNNRIEPSRYYELFEKDLIKFGNSSREYMLLHENSSS